MELSINVKNALKHLMHQLGSTIVILLKHIIAINAFKIKALNNWIQILSFGYYRENLLLEKMKKEMAS